MSDCLHCEIWPVIRRYCAEHPNGCVEDVLIALADVIGDQLSSSGSQPYQKEFIQKINKQIHERIKFNRDRQAE